MNDKIKNIVVTVVFCVMIFGIFITCLLKTPDTISKTERKKLEPFPTLSFATSGETKESLESIKSTKFMKDFETYTLQQFPLRDKLRTVKAFVMYNILNQSDNNKIYVVDGQVSQYTNKMDEAAIKNTVINQYNKLYDKYLKDLNVYYTIVPDKKYFIAEENGYPHIDYEKFESLVCDNMNENMIYVDLFDTLEIDDYYKTDKHWRQEKLDKVVDKLSESMKFTTTDNYEEKVLEKFYGFYYGASALPIDSEKLVYKTNETLENAKVYYYVIDNENSTNTVIKLKKIKTKVYNEEDYKNVDPYDIFLGGSKDFITIENENANTDKELYIFRDSFGSSLAPLLVDGYKKITILDLRYIYSKIFKNYVKFKPGSDVLIINYVEVINSGSIVGMSAEK